MSVPKSLQVQVGGSHYKKYHIQPLEYAEKIGLNPMCFCAFKYVTRYKDKHGEEDLAKALHCLDVYEECGVAKESIKVDTDYLIDFLSQFDDNQGQALFFIIQTQCNKDRIKEARFAIEKLQKLLKEGAKMETVKCTFGGKNQVKHELFVTMPSNFHKWTTDRKQSHFTSLGRKTYGKHTVLLGVVNVNTDEVYCGE